MRNSVQGDSTKRQNPNDALLRFVRVKVQRSKVQCANSAPHRAASVKSQSTNFTCSTLTCLGPRSCTNDSEAMVSPASASWPTLGSPEGHGTTWAAGDVEEGEGAAFGEGGDEGRAEAGGLLVGQRPPHEHGGGAHHPQPGDALDGVILRGIAAERLQLGPQVLGGLRELPLGLGSERGVEALGDLRVEARAPRQRHRGRRPCLGVESGRPMALARQFERGVRDTGHGLGRRWLVLASVDGLRILDRVLRRRGVFGKGVLAGEARLVLRPGFRRGVAGHQRIVRARRCERQRHGVVERWREEGAVVEPFLGVDPAAHRDLRPVVRVVGSGGGVLHPDDERPDLLPRSRRPRRARWGSATWRRRPRRRG